MSPDLVLDWKSVELDGIDIRDLPDLSDVYIRKANWADGTPLTDEALDWASDYYASEIHQLALERL